MLMKEHVDWMLENIHYPGRPSMYGINYVSIVCMPVVLTNRFIIDETMTSLPAAI